jgi:hypothetical protein
MAARGEFRDRRPGMFISAHGRMAPRQRVFTKLGITSRRGLQGRPARTRPLRESHRPDPAALTAPGPTTRGVRAAPEAVQRRPQTGANAGDRDARQPKLRCARLRPGCHTPAGYKAVDVLAEVGAKVRPMVEAMTRHAARRMAQQTDCTTVRFLSTRPADVRSSRVRTPARPEPRELNMRKLMILAGVPWGYSTKDRLGGRA